MSKEKPTCTRWRFRIDEAELISSFFEKLKKSTQNEVVKAVKAESVVAKVAAVRPNIKTIAGIADKWLNAISGNRKSVRGFPVMLSNGIAIPYLLA
jgi:hypothetical protein